MKKLNKLTISIITFCLTFVWSLNAFGAGGGGAFGNQGGNPSTWNYAGKTGLGTSYEQYLNKQYSNSASTGTVSKVWFSIAHGIVTETAYGLIHEAQIKDLQFMITGNGFVDEEKVDTTSKIEYIHTDDTGRPLSLAYRVINTDKDGKYQIEKHILTDPDRQTLFMRVKFTANEDNITPYILINPHMKNTGNNDVAYVSTDYLNAREGDDRYLCLKSTAPFVKTSAGFVGESDGWTDLQDNGLMDWEFDWADKARGNVAMMAQLQTLNSETKTFDIVIGFGESHADALSQADGSLTRGYNKILKKYNGAGSYIGWEDYIQSLSNLPSLIPFTGDNGRLLYVSALVLKAMEDKTHAGALIASLSIPWGDNPGSAEEFNTGYRAVWVRDFYQVATTFMAMGDNETALVAFEYLPKVQVTSSSPGIHPDSVTGWFLQKTHVNGIQEWLNVQMDQTAMPIMLGWKLWKAGAITDSEMSTWYFDMLKPAAEFLANGGFVHIHNISYHITPPFTQQERWEEQKGYSPSTTAAIITGLITAADIANNAAGDPGAASFYETKADEFENKIEDFMFTTTGVYDDGKYFLRITQNTNPNDGNPIEGKNGQPTYNEKEVLDAGFLELVRYGVRAANHSSIIDSLPEIDDMNRDDNSRLKYEFNFVNNSYPGWRRYAKGDGYGERTGDGSNFHGDHYENRGRIWPIFTGERGHYEMEKIKAGNNGMIADAQIIELRNTYVRAMEHFANEGLMLPEQVWDGIGSNSAHNYVIGEGTNSATPLAWTHAEYVKLVRSLADKNTWNSYQIVRDRYQGDGNQFKKTFNRVFLRGTPNGWGISSMKLVADFTWQITIDFGSGTNERFKFDVNGQNWAFNFGDNQPVDGIADQNGADIPITQGAGSYTITLNDIARAYVVIKKDGVGNNSTFTQVFFRGTPNGWGTSLMKLVADFTWQITVNIGSGTNERFKFDVHGDWSHNYGDNPPQNGIADQNGADIPVVQGAGDYTIIFNDKTKAYFVVKD